jgi:hypothetical protein
VTESLPPLIFAATHGSQSREAAVLRRDARKGLLESLHPGVFVDAAVWRGLDPREQHRLRVRAVMSRLAPGAIASHSSAVALHGLPSAAWPRGPVHVIDPRRTRTQVSDRVVRHPGPIHPDDVVEVDGLLVTTEHRTAVDAARSASFDDGVLCVDALLRREAVRAGAFSSTAMPSSADQERRGERIEAAAGVARILLLERIDASPGARGLVAARQVVAFATPWAENGGESLCRVALMRVGAPEPLMQVEFFDELGLAGRCDFVLGDVALEFDGKVKYDDEAFRGGKAPSAVIRAEKMRERRLLRAGGIRALGRCDSDDVDRLSPLAATLRDLGVPLRPCHNARMWTRRQE